MLPDGTKEFLRRIVEQEMPAELSAFDLEIDEMLDPAKHPPGSGARGQDRFELGFGTGIECTLAFIYVASSVITIMTLDPQKFKDRVALASAWTAELARHFSAERAAQLANKYIDELLRLIFRR